MSEEGFIEYSIKQLENAMIAQIMPDHIAAIVIEPVQGEGGFLPTPPRFLKRIRELCDEHGIVMICDEIQCGFGRTGKLWASEHYGLKPDLMTTAKSFGSGMPIAAVVGKAEIMDAPHPGGLGGTYSGNPLACVSAIEAMKLVNTPEFLSRAEQVGKELRAHLEQIQADNPNIVGDVRGLGPMLVMELVKDAATKEPDMDMCGKVTSETIKHGLITIRAGLYSNCVRFLPPLNISSAEIDEGMAILAKVVKQLNN